MTKKDKARIRKAMKDAYQLGIDAWVVDKGRVLHLDDKKDEELKDRIKSLFKYLDNTTEAKLERWPRGLFP